MFLVLHADACDLANGLTELERVGTGFHDRAKPCTCEGRIMRVAFPEPAQGSLDGLAFTPLYVADPKDAQE